MEFPAYFTFDGTTVSTKPIEATWTATVRIRAPWNTTLTLQGRPSSEPFITPRQIGRRSLPLLKSNLQKCVRRKDFGRAARTALAMFSFKPDEVLRRLPMIMVEDTLLYPFGMLRLVWWMCAVSKGYQMSKAEVESMLGILSTMCDSEHYEVCQLYEPRQLDWRALAPAQQDFLWALEIRRLYGGMKVDGRMLGFHQERWLERFSERESKWWDRLSAQDEYRVEVESVEPVTKDDILLESLDFHVYSWIPRKIREKHEQLTAEEIRLAIWVCRSRINHRVPLTEGTYRSAGREVATTGARIQKDLDGLCRWLLARVDLLE